MSKSMFNLFIAGATLASAQQTGVPHEQRQQYHNERQANAQRSNYQRSQAAALQSYKNCQAAQQRRQNPNPHNCDQYLNDAEYFGKMAQSVRTPDNPLTGSVTDQPLPTRGSTSNIPGGVTTGVIYGIGTRQTKFNENPQTISQDPVVDSRDVIHNTNREGTWQGYSGNARRPNTLPLPSRNNPQPTSRVNSNGYKQVPPGYYARKNRK